MSRSTYVRITRQLENRSKRKKTDSAGPTVALLSKRIDAIFPSTLKLSDGTHTARHRLESMYAGSVSAKHAIDTSQPIKTCKFFGPSLKFSPPQIKTVSTRNDTGRSFSWLCGCPCPLGLASINSSRRRKPGDCARFPKRGESPRPLSAPFRLETRAVFRRRGEGGGEGGGGGVRFDNCCAGYRIVPSYAVWHVREWKRSVETKNKIEGLR